MAATAGSRRVRVAVGQRPHRPADLDRVALPVRRRRPRDLAVDDAVRRRPDRARADGRGDRARDAGHGGARPPAPASGRLRQAGGVDRRRQRRAAPSRRRRRAGCARSSRHSAFPSRIAAAGSSNGWRSPATAGRARRRAALERALHASCGRALPADSGAADPVPDGRPLPRRASPRRAGSQHGWLAHQSLSRARSGRPRCRRARRCATPPRRPAAIRRRAVWCSGSSTPPGGPTRSRPRSPPSPTPAWTRSSSTSTGRTRTPRASTLAGCGPAERATTGARTILLTGASRGIGAATARVLGERRARASSPTTAPTARGRRRPSRRSPRAERLLVQADLRAARVRPVALA